MQKCRKDSKSDGFLLPNYIHRQLLITRHHSRKCFLIDFLQDGEAVLLLNAFAIFDD